MKKLFDTKMTNTGGRAGVVRDPEDRLVLKIAPPDKGDKTATNPEQLFAAGYSSCFNGALELAMSLEGIKAPSTIAITVALNQGDPHEYFISAQIEGHIEGVTKEETERLLRKADQICPYSKAIRGNVEVSIKAV